MKKAYVILVHKNPDQVYRLIQTLDDGMSFFFVHIDIRSDFNQFRSLLSFGKKIEFVTRVKTEWASFGLIEAILNGLKAVKRSKELIEHIILLSGQDYPIKNNNYINEFIYQNQHKIYLEYFSLPNSAKWKPNGGLYRVNKYFLGLKPYQRYAAKTVNLIAEILPFLKRQPYNGMKAFAGSMWWIIDRHTANYILEYVKKNPRYKDFHRYTFAPDELFFHTILLNSPDETIAEAIVNDDKRFIIWRDNTSSHPENISKIHMDDLMNSDALFARKFDTGNDAEILNLVDKFCLSKDLKKGIIVKKS